MSRKRYILITLIIVLIGLSMTAGAEKMTLNQWIERAFETNPDFQFSLQDHQLVLEELGFEKKGGLKSVSFSLGTLRVDNDGFNDNYSASIQYSWQLPYHLQISGSNTLAQNPLNDEWVLNGSLSFSMNPLDLIDTIEDQEMQNKYLTEAQNFYQTRIALVEEVINQYYQLCSSKYQLLAANLRLEKSNLQLAEKENMLEAGVISRTSFYQFREQVNSFADQYQNFVELEREAKRNFARLFGRVEFDEELAQLLDLTYQSHRVGLEMQPVEEFVAHWDQEKAQEYIKETFAYQQAELTFETAQNGLREAKQAKGWQIGLNTGLSYDTENDPEYYGTVSIGREIFNPNINRSIDRAELNLERQKLALEETKTQLIFQLIDQVAKVRDYADDLLRTWEDYENISRNVKMTEEQYQLGYVSELELYDARILQAEKVASSLETERQSIIALIQLGKLLNMDKLYH